MSLEVMAIVLNHSRAKGTDKLVLLGIANHDGDGGAWPHVATLARYANVTERAVQTSLQRLVRMGELAIDRQAGGRDKDYRGRPRARPNLYVVTVGCPATCDGSKNHKLRDYPAATQLTLISGVKQASPHTGQGEADDTPRGEAGFTHNRPTNHDPIAVAEKVTTTRAREVRQPASPAVAAAALEQARAALRSKP